MTIATAARQRKFWVNASPKHGNGIYQQSTDHGLTVSVMGVNARDGIKNAKATGFHKMDDYPKGTTFDFFAVED